MVGSTVYRDGLTDKRRRILLYKINRYVDPSIYEPVKFLTVCFTLLLFLVVRLTWPGYGVVVVWRLWHSSVRSCDPSVAFSCALKLAHANLDWPCSVMEWWVLLISLALDWLRCTSHRRCRSSCWTSLYVSPMKTFICLTKDLVQVSGQIRGIFCS